MSRGVLWSDLGSRKIILAAVYRIDESGERLEAERLIGRLLQWYETRMVALGVERKC